MDWYLVPVVGLEAVPIVNVMHQDVLPGVEAECIPVISYRILLLAKSNWNAIVVLLSYIFFIFEVPF